MLGIEPLEEQFLTAERFLYVFNIMFLISNHVLKMNTGEGPEGELMQSPRTRWRNSVLFSFHDKILTETT